MQRHCAGESCQQKKHVEEAAEHIAYYRHRVESDVEHIGESLEHQSRTGIHGSTFHTEHGREDDESAQNSHKGVDGADTESRLHQIGVGAEVGCIGAQAAHSQTEREECLAHGTKHHIARNLAEIRPKQESEPLGGTRHAETAYHQNAYDEQQHGHHHLGKPLDARAHSAHDDHVGDCHEDSGAEDGFPGMGNKGGEELPVVSLGLQMTHERLYHIVECPAAYNNITKVSQVNKYQLACL